MSTRTDDSGGELLEEEYQQVDRARDCTASKVIFTNF